MMRGKNKNPVPNGSLATRSSTELQGIRTSVHKRLLETLDLNEARRMPVDQLRHECLRRVDSLLNDQGTPLSSPEKQQLLGEVMDEIFGLGPLEEFLRDPEISDILVNGPRQVYLERHGVLEETDVEFRDDDHLVHVIQRIAARVGRRIDESSPMLDARLADGSRVNAIIPPLALDGPAVSIRRFGAEPIDIDRLLSLQSMTEELALFLQACVRAKMNVLISGGTGSGKTTLLNCLSKWIPNSERVVTIEDAAELKLQREHVVRLETRPANIEGKGQVTQRELLRNSLRMRPDRIIIGEVRGAEALDMLQAMNTGHEGSMTTVHANNPRDALMRIENMVSMAGFSMPIRAIRQQLSSALDLVVHLSRLTGGRRRIMSVAEVTAMEGDIVCLQDLFVFRQTGIDAEGHARGQFEARGVRPMILDRMIAEGFDLPRNLFERRVLTSVGGSK
ncbi:MAG: CpaF family protein [Planctomycetota bacterium]|jgi:pilus assembly protein CpaF